MTLQQLQARAREEFREKCRQSYANGGFLTKDYFEEMRIDEKLAADWIVAYLADFADETYKAIVPGIEDMRINGTEAESTVLGARFAGFDAALNATKELLLTNYQNFKKQV